MGLLNLYFSEYFHVEPAVLEEYGAFDISVVSDLPLFVDPFLLFNSDKAEYQALHREIIDYLIFLRDHASAHLDRGLVESWYQFGEVKQNWLGYTLFSNRGAGLGRDFAVTLNSALQDILSNFGDETITRSSHLEKLCLIKPGVGKDGISDFTTNIIKYFLLEYTAAFAKTHLDPGQCRVFHVAHARFNYDTRTWVTGSYYLPNLRNDFILLTPMDLLTKDDTWINHSDMVEQFWRLPAAVPDEQLRGEINQYFNSRLGERASAKERAEAANATILKYKELIDIYIRLQEESGDKAESISAERTRQVHEALVETVKRIVPDLHTKTDFYDRTWGSYDEARARIIAFKHYIENQDGYQLLNRSDDAQPSGEKELQLLFGLIWYNTEFDVNREPNNGRGPVDFKVSFGSADKSLIEFKLARNKQLKRNLQNQVDIYESANQTRKSLKVIVCYSEQEQDRLTGILQELHLEGESSIIGIDARRDNKPSASKA